MAATRMRKRRGHAIIIIIITTVIINMCTRNGRQSLVPGEIDDKNRTKRSCVTGKRWPRNGIRRGVVLGRKSHQTCRVRGILPKARVDYSGTQMRV